MPSDLPKPGKGYVVRERLGRGAWKEAFRGVNQLEMRDVALLVYRDKDGTDQMLKDIDFSVKHLSQMVHSEYSEYVAQFDQILFGEDGNTYFVEELLSQPLDRIAPLRSGERFLRISRDLCRGLQCLHSSGLVHRDIKLDNCGIDQGERAKIFDLGAATSENGSVEGTILTRAPELFADGAKHTKACDVWSLGATLFALRTGKYPFVADHEIAARRAIVEEQRTGKLTKAAATARKAEIDQEIKKRYQHPKAEPELKEKVRAALPGKSADALLQMLRFNRARRPAAKACAELWARLVTEWMSPAQSSTASAQSEVVTSLKEYFAAFFAGEIELSDRQMRQAKSLIAEIEKDKSVPRGIVKELDELRRKAYAELLGAQNQ